MVDVSTVWCDVLRVVQWTDLLQVLEGVGLAAEASAPVPPKAALPALKPLGEANRALPPLKAPAELAPLVRTSERRRVHGRRCSASHH